MSDYEKQLAELSQQFEEYKNKAKKINNELLAENIQYKIIYEHKKDTLTDFMRAFMNYTNKLYIDSPIIVAEHVLTNWKRVEVIDYVYSYIMTHDKYEIIEHIYAQTKEDNKPNTLESIFKYYDNNERDESINNLIILIVSNIIKGTPEFNAHTDYAKHYEQETRIIRKYFPGFTPNNILEQHKEFWNTDLYTIYKYSKSANIDEYINKHIL